MTNIDAHLVIPADAAIHELMSARSKTLAYLLKLNKVIDAKHRDLVQAVAGRFCDTLAEYLAIDCATCAAKQAHQSAALNRIAELIVTFSTKYTIDRAINLREIKVDLEQLAFALEARFEIEDELVCNPA